MISDGQAATMHSTTQLLPIVDPEVMNGGIGQVHKVWKWGTADADREVVWGRGKNVNYMKKVEFDTYLYQNFVHFYDFWTPDCEGLLNIATPHGSATGY